MLTRRFFLIGTAVAVASASMAKIIGPEVLQLPPQATMRLPTEAGVVKREIFELSAYRGDATGSGFIRAFRPGLRVAMLSVRTDILSFGMGPYSNTRWFAPPGGQIVMHPAAPLICIDWLNVSTGQLHLYFVDTFKDGSQAKMMQQIDFSGDTPALIQPLGLPPVQDDDNGQEEIS
jgi:hypothetical protein